MEKNIILWRNFAEKNNLSDIQLTQFQTYYQLLIAANNLFNITTITDLESVLYYHFEDSIKIGSFLDFASSSTIADVGTGGGFPGIPLKIMYPHLTVILLEVSLKKLSFLEKTIETLGLTGIRTINSDWRTFLRKDNSTAINLFCARASLQPSELVRIFSGSSMYRNSTLCYWASRDWVPTKKEASYVKKYIPYSVGNRQRTYCIFSI